MWSVLVSVNLLQVCVTASCALSVGERSRTSIQFCRVFELSDWPVQKFARELAKTCDKKRQRSLYLHIASNRGDTGHDAGRF